MFQISNNYKGHWTSDTSDYCHDTTRDMADDWSTYYVLLIQDTNTRICSHEEQKRSQARGDYLGEE